MGCIQGCRYKHGVGCFIKQRCPAFTRRGKNNNKTDTSIGLLNNVFFVDQAEGRFNQISMLAPKIFSAFTGLYHRFMDRLTCLRNNGSRPGPGDKDMSLRKSVNSVNLVYWPFEIAFDFFPVGA